VTRQICQEDVVNIVLVANDNCDNWSCRWNGNLAGMACVYIYIYESIIMHLETESQSPLNLCGWKSGFVGALTEKSVGNFLIMLNFWQSVTSYRKWKNTPSAYFCWTVLECGLLQGCTSGRHPSEPNKTRDTTAYRSHTSHTRTPTTLKPKWLLHQRQVHCRFHIFQVDLSELSNRKTRGNTHKNTPQLVTCTVPLKHPGKSRWGTLTCMEPDTSRTKTTFSWRSVLVQWPMDFTHLKHK